jgi:MraZ protein
MALFLSTFENKIDKLGRVSAPAPFRSAVAKNSDEYFSGVVLYRSFKDQCIEGSDLGRMETLSNAADNLDVFSEKQDDLTALIFADARQCAFDTTGRILLPKDLITHAGLKDKALFVGLGKTFQIWNPEIFAKKEKIVREKAQKSIPTLKLPKTNHLKTNAE